MKDFATFIPLILLIVVMYFLMIRPQKKKEKETNEMRKNIQVGDEIVTIGGICGKVVKTNEDTIVLQVGSDKTKIEMMKWSISAVSKQSAKRAPAVTTQDKEEEEPARKMPKKLKKEEPAEVKAEEAKEAVETAAETVEAKAEEAAAVVENTSETVE